MNINDIEIVKFSSTLEVFIPELAAFLIDKNRYEFQRKLVARNVDQMNRSMMRGEFPLTTVTLCTSLDSGKTDLIDGFHRLTTARDHGHTFRANLQKLTVRTEADKRALWMYYDGGGEDRRGKDFRVLVQAESAGMTSYTFSALEKGSAAIARGFSEDYLIRGGKGHSKTPLGERFEIIERFLPSAHLYSAATKGAAREVKSPLSAGYLMAFGCVLIEAKEEMAVPFFRSIALRDGLKTPDPRCLFFNSLTMPGALTRDVFRTMQRLAQCWNSHYGGETRIAFRFLGPGIVIPLKGTGFTIGGDEN